MRGYIVRPRATTDDGSGSVLALGIITISSTMLSGLALIAQAALVSQRVAHAADASALAAVDTRSGYGTGQPCERARTVAATYGVDLIGCVETGDTIVTHVRGGYLGIPAEGRARARPG